MKYHTRFEAFLAALLLFVTAAIPFSSGCKSPTLQEGGSYYPGSFVVTTDPSGVSTTNFVASAAPDKAFFIADSSYLLAHAMVDSVFQFERDNRLALWRMSPDIKHNIDALRPRAVGLQLQWARARQAYMASPRPASLDRLGSILAQMQALAAAAVAAMPVDMALPPVNTITK